jgi:Leucine-rich repeat (LRR) protein
MKQPIEISPYGNLLVYKKTFSVEYVRRANTEKGLNGLRIFDHLDPLDSLDFLEDYKFLKELDIDCIFDHNYGFLKSLTNLVGLGIGPSVKDESLIDLSNLSELERLSLQWRKNRIVGLEKCINLRELSLVDFREVDFASIRYLSRLRRLRVKTSSIKTASGLENIRSLEEILLANCRNLELIGPINGLPALKSLEIELCTKIEDYEILTLLPELEYLRLTNCKGIKSIQFIQNFPKLKKLALLGNTSVLDGNLHPADRVPEKYISPQKHYAR